MGGQGDPQNCARNWNLTIQTSEICTTQNPSKKRSTQTSLGFWDTNRSSNLRQITRPSDSQEKENQQNKWKKKMKYLDLARELTKLWNMEVMVIPVVIGVLSTVPKGLVQGDLEIRGRAETIQTTVLLRSAWILRNVLETCCHSDSNEKSSTKGVKKTVKRIEKKWISKDRTII